MKILEYTLPSAWASAIVNIDYSGMSKEDTAALNTFLANNGLSFADCLGLSENVGFCRRHDAFNEMPLAADCSVYLFPEKG